MLSTFLSYSGLTISNWHNNLILLLIFPSTAQVRCQASKNLPFCQPSFARQSILSASSKLKDTNIESICATPKIQQPGVQSFGNSADNSATAAQVGGRNLLGIQPPSALPAGPSRWVQSFGNTTVIRAASRPADGCNLLGIATLSSLQQPLAGCTNFGK